MDGVGIPFEHTKMRKSRFAYNLHNIVHVASNVRIGLWDYFRSRDSVGGPELDIEWSGDVPAPSASAKKLRNFAYEPDSDLAIFRENWLGLSMTLAVRNLSSNKLKIQLMVREKRGWLAPVRPPRLGIDYLLRVLLHLVLIQKGHTMTHAACLQAKESGKGLMIAAPSFSGKTSTTITLARSGFFNYLSDDITIVDGQGKALAYPTPVNASRDLIRRNGLALDWRSSLRLSVKAALSRIAPEPLVYPRTMIPVTDRLPVARSTTIDSFCLLVPGSASVEETSEEEMLKNLLLLNRGEFFFFEHPFTVEYAYMNQAFPMQRFEMRHEEILRDAVGASSRHVIVRAASANEFAEVIRREIGKIF